MADRHGGLKRGDQLLSVNGVSFIYHHDGDNDYNDGDNDNDHDVDDDDFDAGER